MNTQVFETVVEFVKSNSEIAATSDFSITLIMLLAAVLLAATGICVFASRKSHATAAAGRTFSSSTHSPASKASLIALVLALLLALGVLLPTSNVFAASTGRDVNATVPAKITATVDDKGTVTIGQGTIKNSDDVLAIGIRRVAVESSKDLGDATLTIKLGNDVLYSGAIGAVATSDEYVIVPKDSSAELSYSITMSEEKAKELIGTAPITIKTTVDAVSAPTGKVSDIDGACAGATVTATYKDPYTDAERTFTTTTDENGVYTLEPMRYDTAGTIKVVDSKGYIETTGFSADVNQAVEDIDMPYYLMFTNAQDSASSVTPKFKSGSWEYSTDGGETWTAGTNTGATTITLAKGKSVVLAGENCVTNVDNHFSMTGAIAASGSVTSLTDGKGNDPEIQLTNKCYSNMFNGCASLTQAPVLLATKLAEACYRLMFADCTSLTQAPALPATTLTEGCYEYMFANCTSLTQAPALPATKFAESCYSFMFNGCRSLKVSNQDYGDGISTKFFTCPGLNGLMYPTNGMFGGTSGSYTSIPVENGVYYWNTYIPAPPR